MDLAGSTRSECLRALVRADPNVNPWRSAKLEATDFVAAYSPLVRLDGIALSDDNGVKIVPDEGGPVK